MSQGNRVWTKSSLWRKIRETNIFRFPMLVWKSRKNASYAYLSTVRHGSSSPQKFKSKDVLKSHDGGLQKSQGGCMLKRRSTWRTLPSKMKKMRSTIYALKFQYISPCFFATMWPLEWGPSSSTALSNSEDIFDWSKPAHRGDPTPEPTLKFPGKV